MTLLFKILLTLVILVFTALWIFFGFFYFYLKDYDEWYQDNQDLFDYWKGDEEDKWTTLKKNGRFSQERLYLAYSGDYS